MTFTAVWSFIVKYRYALIVIVALIALHIYIGKKIDDAEADLKKDHKIEKLEDSNDAMKKDIDTRRKQNEVLVRDITPAAFDNILHKGTY